MNLCWQVVIGLRSVTIKGLIRDALAELAKSPLDGETTTSLSMPLLAEILSDD